MGKHKETLSLCLITDGRESAGINALLPLLLLALRKVNGELILAGDLNGIKAIHGVEGLHIPESARDRRWAKLQNLAISRSRGKLILSTHGVAIISPENWPNALLEWSKLIDEKIAYMFGCAVASTAGARLGDWVRVDGPNKVSFVEYGEQSINLALSSRFIGMSRPAWESSGGFNEDYIGYGEETEFTQRCSSMLKIPLIFCDAFHMVQLRTLSTIE